MKLYTEVLIFAAKAHDTQLRKYTKAPYITHPVAVAQMVHSFGGTDEMVAAALLHDTVEDTDVTIGAIEFNFGPQIAELVIWLTDDASIVGNRAFRKTAALQRLASAPAEAQTVKVADLIDNTYSIVEHDSNFAIVFLKEKRALLDVLHLANPHLLSKARQLLAASLTTLEHERTLAR